MTKAMLIEYDDRVQMCEDFEAHEVELLLEHIEMLQEEIERLAE